MVSFSNFSALICAYTMLMFKWIAVEVDGTYCVRVFFFWHLHSKSIWFCQVEIFSSSWDFWTQCSWLNFLYYAGRKWFISNPVVFISMEVYGFWPLVHVPKLMVGKVRFTIKCFVCLCLNITLISKASLPASSVPDIKFVLTTYLISLLLSL